MKKLLIILSIILPLVSHAQGGKYTSLNVYGGYTFTDRVNLDASYTDIKGGLQWGGGLEYYMHWDQSIELSYTTMSTQFPLYGLGGAQVNVGNEGGSVSYAKIGTNRYFGHDPNAKKIPYTGISIGAGFLSGENGSETKFSWDARFGVKFKTNSKINFKLQAYVQSIISAFSADFWLPNVITYAYPGTAQVFQFGLGGVLGFDLGKK
jgi:hypothetical protein